MRRALTRVLNYWLNSYSLGYIKEGRPVTEHPVIDEVVE